MLVLSVSLKREQKKNQDDFLAIQKKPRALAALKDEVSEKSIAFGLK